MTIAFHDGVEARTEADGERWSLRSTGQRRRRDPACRGFSLLELLVVTAILGLLAAIAIPQYASYKEGAIDSSMESTLHSARTAMEAFYGSNGGSYAGASVAALEVNGYRITPEITLEVVRANHQDYSLRACAPGGSATSFTYDSNVGHSDPGNDGC
jgi:prepilin-type N-terminal cleavage/methylation domain-containing protein